MPLAPAAGPSEPPQPLSPSTAAATSKAEADAADPVAGLPRTPLMCDSAAPDATPAAATGDGTLDWGDEDRSPSPTDAGAGAADGDRVAIAGKHGMEAKAVKPGRAARDRTGPNGLRGRGGGGGGGGDGGGGALATEWGGGGSGSRGSVGAPPLRPPRPPLPAMRLRSTRKGERQAYCRCGAPAWWCTGSCVCCCCCW